MDAYKRVDRRTDGLPYILLQANRQMDGRTDTQTLDRVTDSNTQTYVLNTCQWRVGLRDEYTDRRTLSHFSHPHYTGNYVHMLTRPYTYTLQMCLHVRTHPHPSLNIEVISLKIDVRNKKLEVRS